MQLFLYQGGKEIDISGIYTSITWSGSKSEVARKMEISLVNSDKDFYMPKVNPQLGELIRLLTTDGKELFQGFILNKNIDALNDVISLMTYDGLFYLLQSEGIYNFNKKTAESITAAVCNDMQIPTDSLAVTGIVQDFPANGTLYKIIRDAYEYAEGVTGKKYHIILQHGKLSVIEIGQNTVNYILSENTNMTAANYTENIENLVSKVKIYNDAGKQVGEVQNGELLSEYGVFQKTYTVEDGKDSKTAAKNMLQGIVRTASVEGIGNTECVAGNKITVQDSITGLSGSFFIVSDAHTFAEGQHTMNLELEV